MLASTVAKMRLPALSLIINRPFRVSIDLTVYGLISGKLTKSIKNHKILQWRTNSTLYLGLFYHNRIICQLKNEWPKLGIMTKRAMQYAIARHVFFGI